MCRNMQQMCSIVSMLWVALTTKEILPFPAVYMMIHRIVFFNSALERISHRHKCSEKDRKIQLLMMLHWCTLTGKKIEVSCLNIHDLGWGVAWSWCVVQSMLLLKTWLGSLEVLSQEFAVLSHVLMGALQVDVYLGIFTSWCVPAWQCHICTITMVRSVYAITGMA